jgi:hypothetical protein
MKTTGVASSKVIMKFKAYRSNEKLSFTTGLPEIAGNLGKVANVVKEYEMTNIAAGTAAVTDIVSLDTGFVGAMLASNKWAWWKTGNQMDAAFKVFKGKVQYFSEETDAAGATAVTTAVTEYAKTAWIGSCLGATCKYGAKELAATSAAAAGAGSLGLASVGAAIVLAMAF